MQDSLEFRMTKFLTHMNLINMLQLSYINNKNDRVDINSTSQIENQTTY